MAGHEPRQARIPVWINGAARDGHFESLMRTNAWGYDQQAETFDAADGFLTLTLKEESSVILRECRDA